MATDDEGRRTADDECPVRSKRSAGLYGRLEGSANVNTKTSYTLEMRSPDELRPKRVELPGLRVERMVVSHGASHEVEGQ